MRKILKLAGAYAFKTVFFFCFYGYFSSTHDTNYGKCETNALRAISGPYRGIFANEYKVQYHSSVKGYLCSS